MTEMTAVHWSWYLMTISLVIAYDDLSNQKTASQSTTFTGTYDLYKASNAVDRDITTCTRTEQIGLSSPDNTVWWKVDLGEVYNIYSVNILFRNYVDAERQRGRFAGFSLYVSFDGRKEFLCYKDGPMLPQLNMTITCNTAGRYVRFHNERRDGVTYPTGYEMAVYTELCEVIVYGCYKDGVFGNNCNTPCSGNCKTNTCHIQDGSCFACKPGWTGATCNAECTYGWYGMDCNQPCPGHCRNNVTCDHLTGLCNGGCVAGWDGSFCNRPCATGWYGPDCKLQCFGHCKDNTACNHVTGSCDAGCAAGWYGLYCDEACVQSFGENCQYSCSTNCVNKTCDRFTGHCLFLSKNGSNGGDIFSDIDLGTHSTFWSYGGPISVGINLVLIVGAFIGLWAVYSKRMFVSFKQQSSARSDLYTEAEVIPEDHSHYQELGVSEGETPYQNTSLNH